MDIAREIDRHLEWIETVVSLIGDDNVSADDIEAVTQHESCALGQWLKTEGSQVFRNLPELDALKASHEIFHKMAGEMISAVETGNEGEATALQQKFVAQSQELIRYLNVLQQKSV